MRWQLFSMIAMLAAVPPARAAAPDFDTQIIPVLTKAGCNSGACHGAAIGRGGFRLSLLGYDPASDYDRLVHEFEGRRVHLVQPEKSLVLRKPNGQVPHEGGVRLGRNGDGYRLLLDWIKAGAPRTAGRSLVGIDITPASKTLATLDDKFAIQVMARFSDGTKDNVTPWAVFTPADTASVRCSNQGEVTALRKGASVVMVRFLGEVGAVRVIVPLGNRLAAERPKANFIDEHVNRLLDQLWLPHSSRADDVTLARRLFLDLTGTLPTPEEVAAFQRDVAAGKYEEFVERLMGRPQFVDHWAYKWGDLFRIESRRLQPQGATAFHGWAREQIAKNTPWDRVARELIQSTGNAHANGPPNFHRVAGDAGGEAEYLSQVFLGVRLQCANCHNHPLDRWTQDDYHGLSAIFARMERGTNVALKDRGEVIHPKTGQAAVPRIPGSRFLPAAGDHRQALADWLTAADNPHFSRAIVNRLWRELMGRGLVEPVDDHRASNPATHPELLDELSRDFVKHRFDLRHIIRSIVLSESYRRSALSVPGNQDDSRYYAKALVRPLPAVVLVDAVARVTGVPEKLGDLPAGTQAIALGDSRVASEPLDLLGRCNRDNDCGATATGGLALTLHRIHGHWLNRKIGDPQGRLQQLIAANQTDEAIVSALYQSALSRPPAKQEMEHWKTKLATADAAERNRRLEDFLWALLNSVEFTCNH